MCHRYSLSTSRRHPASRTSSSPGSSLLRANAMWRKDNYEHLICTPENFTPVFADLWVAAAALSTAGCLCTTEWWANRKISPATWWRTDTPPGLGAERSESRCFPDSTDLEPSLQRQTRMRTANIRRALHPQCCAAGKYILTFLSLLSLCNRAPQDVCSSCNSSCNPPDDAPIFDHFVSRKRRTDLKSTIKAINR